LKKKKTSKVTKNAINVETQVEEESKTDINT